MPYDHHKSGKNEVTVTKKDGSVVGHTTPGKLNAYLAALHIHEPKNMSGGGEVDFSKIKDLNPSIMEMALRRLHG